MGAEGEVLAQEAAEGAAAGEEAPAELADTGLPAVTAGQVVQPRSRAAHWRPYAAHPGGRPRRAQPEPIGRGGHPSGAARPLPAAGLAVLERRLFPQARPIPGRLCPRPMGHEQPRLGRAPPPLPADPVGPPPAFLNPRPCPLSRPTSLPSD